MKMRRPALLGLHLLIALPLAGCYGDVDSFAKAAAKQGCKRLQECDKAIFDEEYGGDLGRCRDDSESDLLDAADLLEEAGCDYVPDQGRECIKATRQNRNECSEEADQDIADACEEVFKCPDLLPGGLENQPELISDIISH